MPHIRNGDLSEANIVREWRKNEQLNDDGGTGTY